MIHFWSLLSSHELSLPTPSPPSVHRTSLTSFVPSGGRREGMEDPTGGRRDGGNDTRWTEHDDQGTDVNAVSKPLASVLCSLRSWACHSPPIFQWFPIFFNNFQYWGSLVPFVSLPTRSSVPFRSLRSRNEPCGASGVGREWYERGRTEEHIRNRKEIWWFL